MSHIATEEWQSFELRMRRRRAERMLLHAEAALDAGCPDEARAALDEARRLSPALPSLDDLEARITEAAAPVVVPPAATTRRSLGALAGVALIALAAIAGWRILRTSPAPQPAISPVAAAGLASTAPKTPTPPPAPSIRIETEQIPPVVVSGPGEPDDKAAAPAPPPAAAMKSAALVTPKEVPDADRDSHAVGTTGPTTVADASKPPDSAPPSPINTGIDLPPGRTTALPPPVAPAERIDRTATVASAADAAASLPATGRVAPAPAPTVPKKMDETALVRTILDKYADAYTRLDADAAKAVWPSVNRAALSRAFDGLNEQRIAFSDCSVLVRSTQAKATCSGSTTWEPKIGGGPRTDVRRWAFDLEKSGDDWVIRDARVQNR